VEIFDGGGESRRGPADWFTGVVWIDMVLANTAPQTLSSARVSFEPGARTAWHTHPHGQGIYVLSGVCQAQARGGPLRDLHAGAAAWFSPGEVHWHGAKAGHTMVHLATQFSDVNGVNVTWMEHVNEAEIG
jgi:quercetin dioxygenase-like cupin family protein